MYNDKTGQFGVPRSNVSHMQGRSRPAFSKSVSDILHDDLEIGIENGGKLCDGSYKRQNANHNNECADKDGHGWGVIGRPLAMVYSPYQYFRNLYSPDTALIRGTLFAELDLPFEGDRKKCGGC